jgi:hypothetical protein
MKMEYLNDRIHDYKNSIKTVVEKKIIWKNQVKALISKTLSSIVKKYDIGWCVQELTWIGTNDAVNITLNSFPPELIESTNQIPEYQFIQGSALVFYQSYNGNVHVNILFPLIEQIQIEESSVQLGIYNPQDITEKLIVEMVDEFLKEIIKWEVPSEKRKLGFN